MYYTPLNTGLVVEISTDRHDEDLRKEIRFLYDFGFREFFNWSLAVIVSTFVGISDGSTYVSMILIPSVVVAVVAIITRVDEAR